MKGKSMAVIKPFKKIEKQFTPVGFGMWKDRKDLKDAKKWVDELRSKERFWANQNDRNRG